MSLQALLFALYSNCLIHISMIIRFTSYTTQGFVTTMIEDVLDSWTPVRSSSPFNTASSVADRNPYESPAHSRFEEEENIRVRSTPFMRQGNPVSRLNAVSTFKCDLQALEDVCTVYSDAIPRNQRQQDIVRLEGRCTVE